MDDNTVIRDEALMIRITVIELKNGALASRTDNFSSGLLITILHESVSKQDRGQRIVLKVLLH